jgi:hypothetical protein
MLTPSLSDVEMKKLFKEAFIELFEERRELLSGVIAEALEDLAMSHAIREGAASGKANRKEVFQVL